MVNDKTDSVRQSHRQRLDLSRSIDRKALPGFVERRKHARRECKLDNVRLTVRHPDSKASKLVISTRNISAGGLAFLHRGFLHPGSRCEITLPTVSGGEETLCGKVVTCRKIEKQVHEYGLAVDNLVDYQRLGPHRENRIRESIRDSTRNAELAGRVLLVNQPEMEAARMRRHLKNAKVEFQAAESFAEGLVVVRSSHFDVVLLDIDDVVRNPEEMLQTFHQAGFKGPITCISSSPDSVRTRSALAAGADEILERPITTPSLIRILTLCLTHDTGAFSPERRRLDRSAELAELIENYLGYIKSLTASLTTGIAEEDLTAIIKDCRSIAQSAGGYGFPPLEQAAHDALEALNNSNSVTQSLWALKKLQCVCARLEPAQHETEQC